MTYPTLVQISKYRLKTKKCCECTAPSLSRFFPFILLHLVTKTKTRAGPFALQRVCSAAQKVTRSRNGQLFLGPDLPQEEEQEVQAAPAYGLGSTNGLGSKMEDGLFGHQDFVQVFANGNNLPTYLFIKKLFFTGQPASQCDKVFFKKSSPIFPKVAQKQPQQCLPYSNVLRQRPKNLNTFWLLLKIAHFGHTGQPLHQKIHY